MHTNGELNEGSVVVVNVRCVCNVTMAVQLLYGREGKHSCQYDGLSPTMGTK